MKRIKFWFRSFKAIPTVVQAQEMNLTHYTNIFGDGINHLNCRSLWYDEYGNQYKCDELLDGGRDIVMDNLIKEHPELVTMFNRCKEEGFTED